MINGIDTLDLIVIYCENTKKFVLYLNWYNQEYDDIVQAVPFLDFDDFITDRNIFIFDTEEELDKYYYSVVGDDGPSEYNSYNGPCRVYALTIGPNGFITENT